MNELTCREIDEMLAGYAADALEEEESCAAAAHLAECRNHDAELQALRRDFASLAAVAEPAEPPAALRDRLLGAFDQEIAGAPVTLPSKPAQRPSRLISVTTFGYALAAALLLIAVGLGVWGASRGGGTELVVRTTTEQAGALQVTYIPSRDLGVLNYDLDALPAGRAYQAWHVDAAGNPTSLGVLPDTRGRLAFAGDFGNEGAIALTDEPSGGSLQPTTQPMLITPLGEG
jgi:anti-sigma-K factor RskA